MAYLETEITKAGSIYCGKTWSDKLNKIARKHKRDAQRDGLDSIEQQRSWNDLTKLMEKEGGILQTIEGVLRKEFCIVRKLKRDSDLSNYNASAAVTPKDRPPHQRHTYLVTIDADVSPSLDMEIMFSYIKTVDLPIVNSDMLRIAKLIEYALQD